MQSLILFIALIIASVCSALSVQSSGMEPHKLCFKQCRDLCLTAGGGQSCVEACGCKWPVDPNEPVYDGLSEQLVY
ncbi:hypothetical protein MP228_000105 [Amoeboaphelidium protococcarum]|nr:hypothetical protein MP228_004123 [Amoeboaphelidium protococcarum]KAI3654725.1 hypothetical protein MP228_000105 [Amoeboaphelidium protococcarum]